MTAPPRARTGEQLGLDLFDPRAHHRATDPATSIDAATTAARFAAGHVARIVEALRRHGPATATELGELTGLTSVQVARRMVDLRRRGLAAPTGEERPNASGGRERVWRATR